MAVKYDSEANDKVASLLKESIESVTTGISSTISNDFSAMTDLNLFSSQLANLKTGIDSFIKDQESFLTIVQNNKYQWTQVDGDVEAVITNTGAEIDGNKKRTGSRSSSSSHGRSSSYSESGVTDVNEGVRVSAGDVSNIISQLDDDTISVVLKKIYEMNSNKSIIDILVDQTKSGVLLLYLRKILGDTTGDIDTNISTESDAIQKLILTKINKNNLDLTTEDGISTLEKEVLEKINSAGTDEKLNEVIYGNNTTEVNLLDGEWVVAKTKTDLQSYASYISSHGVKQNSNTKDWGDSCLAFAGAHAYDLYAGTKTSGSSAANYAHGSAFTDYIDDDKTKVLSKIYTEIMSGRPVVLQVNGNKAGTSRHFVTVVGFKKGITSAESLTEKDLLIVDSWDGKIERMDTSSSRFFTSGKDCHKDYSGYRLRVFKNA